MKDIFLTSRFYGIFGLIIGTMGFSYVFPSLFYVAIFFLVLLACLFVLDFFSLRNRAQNITATRKVNNPISLGDRQEIKYQIENNNKKKVFVTLIDELPIQLQQRSEIGHFMIAGEESKEIVHPYRPTTRGRYDFGNIITFLSSSLRLLLFRKEIDAKEENAVYPSILQMKRYALQIFSSIASLYGVRKIRRVGENDEFEHLRQYQQGDNINSINWKATSRKGELVVNQYQDTRSQRVYCIIDKGRTMEMPFEGMSLLDYSINSALVISNIVLRKYDNIGLITVGKEIDCFLQANNNNKQLELVLKQLYAQETDFQEANFGLVYQTIRKKISRRSIIFIYTNIETKEDLEIRLPYLKDLSRRHLLILISFKNTELIELNQRTATSINEIYSHTIASQFMYQKEKVLNSLKQHGIQVIYTTPDELSINVINKYLEVKARQMK